VTWIGWLGVEMAVVGAVVIVIELLLLLPRFLRLTKHIDELTLTYTENLRLTRDELRILSQAASETRTLLRPYRRIQRWLRHPLTLALFASYRRRHGLRRNRFPAG
jgi:hypothetical protein